MTLYQKLNNGEYLGFLSKAKNAKDKIISAINGGYGHVADGKPIEKLPKGVNAKDVQVVEV